MNNKVMKLPIKWGIGYSVFTVMMYLFGVWKYPSTNRVALLILLLLYNFSMYFGFVFGTKYNIRIAVKKNITRDRQLKDDVDNYVWKFYSICFWITLVFLIPRFIIYTGLYKGLSISTVLSRVQLTISDVNEAYMTSHTAGNSATGIWKIINFFSVVTSGFSWCFTPLVIFLWKKVKKWHKIFAIFYWILYCIQYIISATNSGIVGQIFYISVSWIFVSLYKREKYGYTKRRSDKSKVKILLIIVVAITLALSIFGYAMSSRVGVNYRTKNIGICSIVYNNGSIFNKVTPISLHPTLAVMDNYLTQGYCALELAISEEWVPTFLIGNSRFLMSNFYELTGINLFNNTYQMRLYQNTGWHYDINWHTAYLWLANDYTLYLLPLFLFALFVFFGESWKEFVLRGNVFGLLGTVLFAQFMFYISANNNLFSLADTLFAFFIVFILFNCSNRLNWDNFSLC